MKKMHSKDKKFIQVGLREKTILFFLMVLLPLGLYAAMELGANLLTWAIAGALMLSMGVLVWLG
jgi:hypothetical protein